MFPLVNDENLRFGEDCPFNDLKKTEFNILYSILNHMMGVKKTTAEKEWLADRKCKLLFALENYFSVLFVLRTIMIVCSTKWLFVFPLLSFSPVWFLKPKANLFLVSVYYKFLSFVFAVTNKQYAKTGSEHTHKKKHSNKHLTTKIQTEQCLHCSVTVLKLVFTAVMEL